MNKKEDLVFIKHILESINAIEEFSKNINKKELISNRLRQSAIIREIEIIGEASKNISEKIKNLYPEIEWKKIVGTRDRLIHNYFDVDLDITYEIIKKDMPILKKQIEKIREDSKKR